MRAVILAIFALMASATYADSDSQSAVIAAGKAGYSTTCIVCHGADGTGAIPGVPDLTTTKGPLSKTDKELIENITEGYQSPGSMMAMPAKGGNPSLSDEDVAALVAYLRDAFGS